MNASELFKAGKLQAAIEDQLQLVKAKPTDGARRLFLFELLVFSGDIDRAMKQGELANFGEVEIDTAMQGYVKLLVNEKARRKVFREGGKPGFFGPPPESLLPRLEALALIQAGKNKDAAAVIAKNPPPPISGTINGKPFDALADCDDLLAPVLEVLTVQGYFWVPLSEVVSLTSDAPKFPRDLFWLPATLELKDQQGPVFLPTLYPFSHEHADETIKLGRGTDWLGQEGEPIRGAGAKTLLAGDDAVGLLDVRELTVNKS
ncbi:MAG: type VI secretion system accessory protein TagJ [Gemmataceae bacterium]